MSARRSLLFVGLGLLACLCPTKASARADFVIHELDDGLQNPRPVRPVGGNTGTTLGAQRRQVIERALSAWGAQLESNVPIVVAVQFVEEEGCSTGRTMLAAAGPSGWAEIPGAAPSARRVFYPNPLANRLAGKDLDPNEADIELIVNALLDEAECGRGASIYYGFDDPGPRASMYDVILHELAHGLGFFANVDLGSGRPLNAGGIDVFSTHVHDLDLDRSWADLSNEQRARSATNVRRLVFDGPETRRRVADFLALGVPDLTLSPRVPDFSGAVAEVGSTILSPGQTPVRGTIALASPSDGCSPFRDSVRGAVVMFELNSARCDVTTVAELAARAGAVGLLMVEPSSREFVMLPPLPPDPNSMVLALPTLRIASFDAVVLGNALERGPIVATIAMQDGQRSGADALGRPLLFATLPILNSSSVAHFDPMARPNLLMEPIATERPMPGLDLTVAVMRDLGWVMLCGNGQLDPNEECDDGDANSDVAADRCRTSCRRATCGDAVVDAPELCDTGSRLSLSAPDACRPDCRPARCGDGVVDRGEECDGTADCKPSCELVGIKAWDADATAERDTGDDGCTLAPTHTRGTPWASLGLFAALVGARLGRSRRRSDKDFNMRSK